jgi:hypothetical protein
MSWLSWGLSVLPRDLSGGCCGHCGVLLLWESVTAEVAAGAVSWASSGLSPWVILDFPVLSEAATRHSVAF